MTLAPYACDPYTSRGRRVPEQAAPTRTDFQRDRDRVVHSTAFRRLVYKTQVFLNHEGDLFRTRLTHSLEVAQLARSIARTLRLNEDLVEGVALGHDLGHTPFGHAGQDALHACMHGEGQDWGGFEHNLQSLRVVDELEERYGAFDGLNLCFETREGLLKHCSVRNARLVEAREPDALRLGKGGVGRRFLDRTQPSLEAQLCNLADEIAYNAHDIDDGVRSGLLTLEQMTDVPLFKMHMESALKAHPGLQGRRVLYETIRLMLSAQVYDVIDTSQAAIREAGVATVEDVRACRALVAFGEEMAAQSAALKRFLFQKLYRHPRVMETTQQAQQVVRELFALYLDDPKEMQSGFWMRAMRGRAVYSGPTAEAARAAADYIAGMTDRFAIREHERLTGKRLLA